MATSTYINVACIPDKEKIKLYENHGFTYIQDETRSENVKGDEFNNRQTETRTKQDKCEEIDVQASVKDITDVVYSEVYSISTQPETTVPNHVTRRNSCKRNACVVSVALLVLCVCTGVGYGVCSNGIPTLITTDYTTLYTTQQPIFWLKLHNASAEGNLTWVQYLLDQGANIDILDAMNETPLYKAIKHKHLDVVKLLIENGADMNWRAGRNKYPLLFAYRLDQDIGKYLYDNGAKLFAVEDS